ncbi:GtrA family protein [Blastococcus xanthinilyticus]|uniref:Putative flippase GtrA n=1 Tax=Blastococcus xanthinilyticus TaxID=1564164 RepID=A0A5S5D3L4_9ACTN|nr:GtrA family protein [Blastococcus xanthinilyticus]TYP89858.1 putative flippase GtrA [Blastococcus xanthinilyticus]
MGFLARLRRLVRDGERRLIKELGAFGIVGIVCFVVDLGLFQLLYAQAGLGAVTAKLVAGLVSTTLAFLGHRFWSFAARARTGLRREYSRFVLVNASTLLLSVAVVAVVRYPLGQESPLVLQVANVGAIAAGTLIRWLVYRRWVFPARETAAPAPRVEATTGQL